MTKEEFVAIKKQKIEELSDKQKKLYQDAIDNIKTIKVLEVFEICMRIKSLEMQKHLILAEPFSRFQSGTPEIDPDVLNPKH
jgi:hypothetical protein